jgi:hypothetical protein
LGSFSIATIERASISRRSPARTCSSRSDAASVATISSSPRPMITARSSPSRSLTVMTSPARSGSRISTTLSASFRITSAPRRRPETSSSGAAFTRILRPPVKTSTEPSSFCARNTPNVAGGCESFSTSSRSASIRSFSASSVDASFSFWPSARERSLLDSRSFSSRILT